MPNLAELLFSPPARLHLIAGEHPRPRIDNVKRIGQKRRMSHYRTLALKEGHWFAMWQWIAKGTARTECHECEAAIVVDFTLDRADELTVSDALDAPCMVAPPR